MEIIMMPTTDIGSLCEEVNRKYGWQLDDYDLCQILFGEEYNNYSYKPYRFDKDVNYGYYTGEYATTGKDIENKVRQYLRERLPHNTHILIDVSW